MGVGVETFIRGCERTKTSGKERAASLSVIQAGGCLSSCPLCCFPGSWKTMVESSQRSTRDPSGDPGPSAPPWRAPAPHRLCSCCVDVLCALSCFNAFRTQGLRLRDSCWAGGDTLLEAPRRAHQHCPGSEVEVSAVEIQPQRGQGR